MDNDAEARTLRGMLTWEDLQPGQKYRTGEYVMTADEIVAFARQYDPQPFHLDAEAAKTSLFGELVASGWHTAAVSMRLMVQGEMQIEGGVIGHLVEELRFPRPVRPGDRLHVVQEVVAKSEMPGRPTHGRLTLSSRTYNQDGKTVQHMTSQLVVQRRLAAGS